MRRETSTVVVLAGEVGGTLLAGLAGTPNVSLVRAPEAAAESAWERGALAMREAAHRRSTYVVVADDPLADVAASWRAMWELPEQNAPVQDAARQKAPVQDAPGQKAAGFEQQAATALAAWRSKQFELPDYYLFMAPAEHAGTGPDLYLGPLRAARPRRVAVAGVASGARQADHVLDALRALEHGPWWPPLDELLDSVRHFFAGGIAETQNGTIGN